MSETFRQYIKIRSFLGYRPKEIQLELQNVFGNRAPTYTNVQRWSKRFRDAIDSPLGSPLASQSNFETQDFEQSDSNNINEDNDNNQKQKPINANAKKSGSKQSRNETTKPKQSSGMRSKAQRFKNE